MEKNLYDTLLDFKKCLEKDKRIVKLNEAEKAINDSFEVSLLIKAKDEKAKTFGYVLSRFPENSKEVKKAQKDLYEAKLALDSHPLVNAYRDAYKDVNDLYMYINKSLFDKFNIKSVRNAFDD